MAENVVTANSQARIIQKSVHRKSLMVWRGITEDRETPLVLGKTGVKLNQQCFQDEILLKALQPFSQKELSGRNWKFQQVSAPAHRAHKKLERLR